MARKREVNTSLLDSVTADMLGGVDFQILEEQGLRSSASCWRWYALIRSSRAGCCRTAYILFPQQPSNADAGAA